MKHLSLALARLKETLFYRKDSDRLYSILGGHIFFQTLSAACELDLFTLLIRKGSLSLKEIAETLELEPKPVRILLLGCTTLGLVERTGDRYSATAVSQRYLNRDNPDNWLPIIAWQAHINYHPIAEFLNAIKANRNVGLDKVPGDAPTLYGRLAKDPRLEQIFQDAMRSISRMSNWMLPEYIDFSASRHLVDVGGGDGTNIMTIANRNSHLKATVFDSPTVCEIARKNIEARGMSSQCDAHPGNCFDDPFPQGCDAILFAHFFTIYSEQKNQFLLKKAYESLQSGGRVILFNMMQANSEDGPLTAAIGSPYFITLATGEGMLYTWQEYQQWMREAGFEKVETLRLLQDHGLIIGTKA
jgi:ubiquinone/menaquinone biosynthesis C-methylase UbiE